MTPSMLSAGAARRIISPPRGIFLIGYGDRTKGNIGDHDDLTATALVLDDGKTRVAIVALDILTINELSWTESRPPHSDRGPALLFPYSLWSDCLC